MPAHGQSGLAGADNDGGRELHDTRSLIQQRSSIDGDEHARRVCNDVEDGGSLLRLSDQCLDVVFGRIGSDVEMNANGAKPIAHLVIHPKDALNIHVGLECCLDRMELNAASLRDCCYTGRKAARQTGEDKLNGSWSIVFGRKDLRVVRLDSERLVAG